MKNLTILLALLFSFSLQASRLVSGSIGLQSLFSDSYRTSTGYLAGVEVFPLDFLYLGFQYDAAQVRVDTTHPDYTALNGNTVSNYSFGAGLNSNYVVNGYHASTSAGFYYTLVKNAGASTNGFSSEIREDFFFYQEIIGVRLAFQYKGRKIPFTGGVSGWQEDFSSNASLLIAY